MWDAAPIRPGARRITLFTGLPTVRPTSTTWLCYAAGVTIECMMKTGKSNRPLKANMSSNPHPQEIDGLYPSENRAAVGADPLPNSCFDTTSRARLGKVLFPEG